MFLIRINQGKITNLQGLFLPLFIDQGATAFDYLIHVHNKILREKWCLAINWDIRLSPELHKKAAYNASMRRISLNQYINDAIKKEIESSDTD